MSALSLPEVKHMLDVLLGSLSALDELMKTARKDKDPSIIRLAVSEAETASKTCVRLSQAISAYEAEHPEEVNRNRRPANDPEMDGLWLRFFDVVDRAAEELEAQRLGDRVEAHFEGIAPLGGYRVGQEAVLTPDRRRISFAAFRNIKEKILEIENDA